MKPLISIIIPVYNRVDLISETLFTVLRQTYHNWECILVDDGSTDDVKKKVNEFTSKDNRFKFHYRPEHKRKGANSCRNFGVEKSEGDFFLFLDSDDFLKEDCLEKRLNLFEQYPDLDFAVFSMGLFRNSQFEDRYYQDLSKATREDLIRLFIKGPLPWNMTRPFWRRDFFLQYKGFNENLDLYDDDEFNIRVIYNPDVKFKIIDTIDCYYRMDEENLSKYKDRTFVKKILKSHLVFLKTLNVLFGPEDKIRFKKELKRNIVGIVQYLNQPNTNKRLFLYNIVFFNANFKPSFQFKILLFFKYLLSFYPTKMKGNYRINQLLGHQIKKEINRC